MATVVVWESSDCSRPMSFCKRQVSVRLQRRGRSTVPPTIAAARLFTVLGVKAVACPSLSTQSVVPFHDIVNAESVSPVYDDAAAVLDVWHLHAGIFGKYLSIVGIDISTGCFPVVIPSS